MPGNDERISALFPPKVQGPPPTPPGASSDRMVATFENEETTSPLVVEPTETALEMQAGWLMVVKLPSLPEAMAVRTPAPRRLSIEAFCTSLSQADDVF